MARRPGATRGVVPGGGPRRFPGLDVLGQVGQWDPVTAGVVLARLGPAPPLRFFTVREEAVAAALFDQLLDQRSDPTVPVLRLVDARLAELETDGWHHERMPRDPEAWRVTLAHLDDDAAAGFGTGFAELSRDEQATLVQAVQDRQDGDWHALPARYVWGLWTRYATAAFYAHPWAWNEIGFGGPAYPRGYKNLGLDAREPWEAPDAAPGAAT